MIQVPVHQLDRSANPYKPSVSASEVTIMASQCSNVRNKTLTPIEVEDMEELNMSEECFASLTPSLSEHCDNSSTTMERLRRIQELANRIITAITAGKSVTAENRKLIINMAHDIERINRENIHELRNHINHTVQGLPP